MTLTVLISLACVLLFRTFFTEIFGLPLIVIVAMFGVSLLTNAMANWSWYQRYEYKYQKLAVYTIAVSVITQVGSIYAIVVLPTQDKGSVLIFSGAALTSVLYGFLYVIVFVKGKIFVNKKYWSFALPYSLAIVPHALAQIVLNSSDRIMIDKLCGRDEAAYYGVAYSAAMVLNIIMISVSSAVQPWYFEKIKSKDFEAIRRRTDILLLLPAILSVLVSLLAPEILAALAPPSYKVAVWIFPSVSTAVFFNSMYLLFANFEAYYEKTFYFSIATTTGAVVNIVLNLIFIPIFGFIAAGYTTLVCYMLFAIMHYVFMRKVCNEKLGTINIFDTKLILRLSITVTILTIGLVASYGFPIFRYCLLGIGISICVVKRGFIKAQIKSALGI
jgi:O-antigen/teichoic acid export membrane protein